MIGLGKHIFVPEWIIGEKLGHQMKLGEHNGRRCSYLTTKLLDEICSSILLIDAYIVFVENLYWLLLDVEIPVLARIQMDVKNVNRGLIIS